MWEGELNGIDLTLLFMGIDERMLFCGIHQKPQKWIFKKTLRHLY